RTALSREASGLRVARRSGQRDSDKVRARSRHRATNGSVHAAARARTEEAADNRARGLARARGMALLGVPVRTRMGEVLPWATASERIVRQQDQGMGWRPWRQALRRRFLTARQPMVRSGPRVGASSDAPGEA